MLSQESKHSDGGECGYEGARSRGDRETKRKLIDGLGNGGEFSALQLLCKCSFLSSCSLPCLMEFHSSHTRLEFHQKDSRGLPWWRSGWESACQCRGHGFEPWSGKIPHAAEQLSPWATTTEPACLEPVLHNRRGRDSERPAHRDEEWPPLATTGESPRTETKTQHSQNK